MGLGLLIVAVRELPACFGEQEHHTDFVQAEDLARALF